MIDWWGLVHNALWVAGLALGLATLSVASFQAHTEGARLRRKLEAPALQLPLMVAAALFCLGLLFSSQTTWERVAWGLLAVLFLVQLVQALAGRRVEARKREDILGADDALYRGPRHAGQRQKAGTPLVNGSPGRARRLAWLGWGLIGAGLLIIGGWAAVTAVELAGRARSLQSHLERLERLVQVNSTDLRFVDLEAAGEELSGLRQDLTAIQRRVGPFLPLGRLLRWMPRNGEDLAAAADLFELALGAASAGDQAFQALEPTLGLLSGSESGAGVGLHAVQQMLPVLISAQPGLRQAQQELDAARLARARVDRALLSDRVSSLMGRLDRYLPWFETAVDAAIAAPNLLGADGARTYLLVAQNNQELRPTGGFISGVGELSVEGGRVTSLSFDDSYAVDNLEVPHEITPADFQQTLFGELFFFRDANWDADFPTSARRILSIYARDRGLEADGVVTLDLSALQLLVDAVGPLEVPGLGEPVTGDTVLTVMQAQWSEPAGGSGLEWWLHRKDFMGQIAGAALSRLMTGEDVELGRLARALEQALDEKHILLYITNSETRALLRERNWDGALPESPVSDMLLVVDSNVGFNKVDPNVERAISYQVDLGHEQGPLATLAVTYRNHSRQPVEACVQESRYGDSYSDMMDRCYWDYLRVYVPAGSELLEGPDLSLPEGSLWIRNGHATSSEPLSPALSEGAWTIWTAFFDLKPGGERMLTFRYRLPAWVVERGRDGLARYGFHVLKQPGTEAVPLRVELSLPAQAALVQSTPPELASSLAGPATIDTDLRTDRELQLVYREQGGAP